MTDHDGRAYRRRSIPFLLLAIMSLLALGAAILAIITGGSTDAGSSAPGTTTVGGDTVAAVAGPGPTSFTGPGPFAAGSTTLALPSDGAPVEEWLPAAIRKLLPAGYTVTYPSGAERGLPVAKGRFPLVIFVHGYSGFRDQSTFLTAHLATWGFVVAAPDLLDHDLTAVLTGSQAASTARDVTEGAQTVDLMRSADRDASSPFAGRLDLTRVGAVGHSLGGGVAEELAASDPDVTTFIGLAGASVGALATGPSDRVPGKPGMLMVGTRDQVVGEAPIVRAFHQMSAPKRLVTIRGAGHLVFADICRIDPTGGGLLGAARVLHIAVPATLRKLATDGCEAPDLPVAQGWPVVRQAVTAQLRHVFGFDSSDAALSGLGTAFPVVGVNVSVAD